MSLSWSVPDLMNHKNEGLNFNEEIVLPLELFRADPEIRRLSPVHVEGTVEFSKKSLTFHLHIEGTMILPCAITLVDVSYPFKIDTSETFLLAGTDIGEEEADEFVHLIENEQIDLIPCLVEAILVEKPIRVVSDQAKAEEERSGDGWTLMTEKAAKQQIDPRLEKLKKFFDD
ncbi:MAG: YceD family protein [Sporolactobacillus sp.]